MKKVKLQSATNRFTYEHKFFLEGDDYDKKFSIEINIRTINWTNDS
jgi:hypothetical protein